MRFHSAKECLVLFMAGAFVFTGWPSSSMAIAQKEPLGETETANIRIEHEESSNVVDPELITAWQAYRNGDIDIAEQHYAAALHKDARSRDALLGMAAIARQRSHNTAALDYYNRILALDPEDPYAHVGRILLLNASGRIDAEGRLKHLLERHPVAAILYFALGNKYANQAQWRNAGRAYSSAVELDPDNAIYALNLAVSQDHLGQSRAAVQHYRKALQLDDARNAKFDHALIQRRLDKLSGNARR